MTHERDHARERPFVADAQADEAEGKAKYLRHYAEQMYGVNR